MHFYYHLSFNHFHILALLESLFPFWENFKILLLAWYQASTLGLSRSVVSDFLRPQGLKPTSLLWPWGFSRQEYWSRLPCPPPGDLPNTAIQPMSLQSPALAGRFFTTSATRKSPVKSRSHTESQKSLPDTQRKIRHLLWLGLLVSAP